MAVAAHFALQLQTGLTPPDPNRSSRVRSVLRRPLVGRFFFDTPSPSMGEGWDGGALYSFHLDGGRLGWGYALLLSIRRGKSLPRA
jgi:hypothetical protein